MPCCPEFLLFILFSSVLHINLDRDPVVVAVYLLVPDHAVQVFPGVHKTCKDLVVHARDITDLLVFLRQTLRQDISNRLFAVRNDPDCIFIVWIGRFPDQCYNVPFV